MMDDVRKKHIVAVFLLALATIGVYSNSLRNSFIWDDKPLIFKDAYIRDISNIPLFFTPGYWKEHYSSLYDLNYKDDRINYRPITKISFCLDYHIWQYKAFGYHLTNMALHLANVILAYVLVYLLYCLDDQKKRIVGPAFLAALFFSVHPIHTETVSWIKNRSDILASMFFLIAFVGFIKSEDVRNRYSKALAYLCSILSFICALFSKASALPFPFILSAYVLYFTDPLKRKRTFFKILPFFGVIAGYFALRLIFFGTVISQATKMDFYLHTVYVFKTIGYYLKLLLLPVGLNAERILAVRMHCFEPLAALAFFIAIFIILMSVKSYFYLTRLYPGSCPERILLLAALWIFAALVPVSNIVILITRPFAEQRLYIPSLGFCMFLGISFSLVLYSRRSLLSHRAVKAFALFLAAAVIFLYARTTFIRNFDWKDSLTFWKKAEATSSNNSRVYLNLGKAYYDKGRYKKAIECYRKAIELNPGNWILYNDLAVALYKEYGLTDVVEENFQKAIEQSPYQEEVYNNIGAMLYAQSGDAYAPEKFYEKAILINPNYAAPYYNLGLMSDRKGDYESAIKYYKKAIELRPSYVYAYNNLGAIYRDLKMLDKAEEHFKRAIRINRKYLRARKNLASLYCDQGKTVLAKKQLEEILKIVPDDETALRLRNDIQKHKQSQDINKL